MSNSLINISEHHKATFKTKFNVSFVSVVTYDD
jgi:hypothetical protein